MESASAGPGNQLLHVDVHIDEMEPNRGILDLLKKLRPQWKVQDIQMKVSNCLITCKKISLYICIRPRLYVWSILRGDPRNMIHDSKSMPINKCGQDNLVIQILLTVTLINLECAQLVIAGLSVCPSQRSRIVHLTDFTLKSIYIFQSVFMHFKVKSYFNKIFPLF